jgi:hypothetical protein
VVGRQPQPVQELGIGEAPADYLVQAAPGEDVLGLPAHTLAVCEHSGGAAPRRQSRRQALEAVDARDLLDQVNLARDVGSPQRGHRDIEPVVGGLRGEVE